MTVTLQAIRGMNDILPSDSSIWQFVEQTMRDTLASAGYQEIRLPIVEKTELFKRSVGEATDIVEKEMYTFEDRNGDSLSLRPEGTAGCVRAGIEHGLLYHQTRRLWYIGPFFRHERPQKGRYRQFHHCGVEAFGMADPDIDAELIHLSFCIFKKLGLDTHLSLELNTLGSASARKNYAEALVDYFTTHQNLLDEDSKRRLTTNPLRILDSKNPAMQSLLADVPVLTDFLDEESSAHFAALQRYLQALSIPFQLNTRLVRGLDYYSGTVFEWVTNSDGAQNAVCSGGRYDGLIEQLGGNPSFATGFAFGLERVILLMQETGQKLPQAAPMVYILSVNEASSCRALCLAERLRALVKDMTVIVHAGGGSLKNQFKKADKSGAVLALVIGEQEMKDNTVTVKYLREETPQQVLSEEALDGVIRQIQRLPRHA